MSVVKSALMLGAILVVSSGFLESACVESPAAPADPEAAYRQAQGFYEEADFSEALDLLAATLAREDLGSDDSLRCLELQALCLVAEGRIDDAFDSFCAIFTGCLDAGWQPDYSRFGPDEKEALGRARALCSCRAPEDKPWWKQKRYAIPIAAVLVGGVAIAASSGGSDGVGDGTDQVPDFPPPPTRD